MIVLWPDLTLRVFWDCFGLPVCVLSGLIGLYVLLVASPSEIHTILYGKDEK